MRNDFAVFILTHGRANKQLTLNALYKCGYTGAVYLVVDDGDDQLEEYKKNYGDMVIVYSKKEVEYTFDPMTNKKWYSAVVYPRNATTQMVKKMGLKYYLMCDDDVQNLSFRVIEDNKLVSKKIRHIDRLFESMIEFMDKTDVYMLGPAYSEAYIGGIKSPKYRGGVTRNLTQIFLCCVDKPVIFRGLSSEDFITDIDVAIQGHPAFALTLIQNISPSRASNDGGMQEFYKENNSYTRDFYGFMAYPNASSYVVKQGEIKPKKSWDKIVPLILSDRHRKVVDSNE